MPAATSEEELLAQEAALTVHGVPKSSVMISGAAHKHYASMFRMWSGWDKGGVLFGDTMPTSPWAYTDHSTQTIVVNPDELLLNPNRLLLTMTPFRMKQEAVLTGTVLHEAGHARFSLWEPHTPKALAKFVHKDGSPISKQTRAFAHMMEEPRIEGLMARDANQIGAVGLAWTMRAAAAHLLGPTTLSADPDQKIIDVIESWAFRAGRHYAVNHWVTSHALNNWVSDMTALTEQAIQTHLYTTSDDQPMVTSQKIMGLLFDMLWHVDHKGRTAIETSKQVLELLFPDQGDGDGDSDGAPMPGAGCKGGKAQPEKGDEPDEGDAEGDGSGQPDQSEDDQPDEQQSDADKALQDALNDMEKEAEQDSGQSEAEAAEEQEQSDPGEASDKSGGRTGGKSDIKKITGQFRDPTPAEMEVKKNAGKFLRSMIDPTSTSKTVLTESPSSTVDGAALAAWRAGGQISDPRFFKRTKRTTTAAPPIKIAVLVDVSSSMNVLQAPSALLSWAMSSAAIDLRNFAGRGVQVESTLIHWGDVAEVIQPVGKFIPGIREVACNQGTSAMHHAFDLIDEQIPGFFDQPAHPTNRLIVSFTDWDLYGRCASEMVGRMGKALGSGVNHLTVFPTSYSARRSDLDDILSQVTIQRGRSRIMTYDQRNPESVWDEAAKVLSK